MKIHDDVLDSLWWSGRNNRGEIILKLSLIKICYEHQHKFKTVINKIIWSWNGDDTLESWMNLNKRLNVIKGHVIALILSQ